MDSLLEYFFEEPEREFHVRELANLARKSPTTISKYLDALKRKGFLLSRNKLNHLLFKANIENRFFKGRKISRNIEKINSSKLIEHLNDKYNHPEAIILFGSFSKGGNTKKSDLDLLVITPIKKELSLEKFEKSIRHKIHIFAYSSTEIKKMKTKNKELLNSFINGIIIEGYWEVFR
jgi:predicted nucleotidyltransferase